MFMNSLVLSLTPDSPLSTMYQTADFWRQVSGVPYCTGYQERILLHLEIISIIKDDFLHYVV